MTTIRLDRMVEAVARRQHGVFTLAQARRAGASRNQVSRRVATGAWIRLDPSVYALAAMPATWRRALKAAELSAEGAGVSGRAALNLHGLPGFPPGRIEITVPSGASGRSRLALVHRSDRVELTRRDGIRVVTAEQALLDVAGRVSFERLESALDHGLMHGVVRLDRLRARYELLVSGRPRGSGVIRALLEERADGFTPAASELERRLQRLLRAPGLPPFLVQAPLPWWPRGRQRVDAFVPSWRLIVEADGRRWHSRVQDFERDRRRDQLAVAHGYRVLRFTWSHLTADRADALALLRRAGGWVVHPVSGTGS